MSTLNIGGQLIENTDYSTGEVKTGARWIDGKPIYRRVFSGTQTTYTDTANAKREFIIFSLSSATLLLSCTGFLKLVGGDFDGIRIYAPSIIVPSTMNTVGLCFDIRKQNDNANWGMVFDINKSYNTTATEYNIVCEYIKTS